MQTAITILLSVSGLGLVAFLLLRWLDVRADRAAWTRLATCGRPLRRVPPRQFDQACVADLPDPAQRYFTYMISSGTPLYTVAQIEMTGELGLGTKEAPNYRPMTARQILSPPFGLVWQLKAGMISGSDGALADTSWTRFWLFNVIPVARISGTTDHLRSAFGRVVAEAAFWSPASLLPSESVTWDGVSNDTARATVKFAGQHQSVDITVAADGQPTSVVINRWSNANPDKTFRWQPFGGTLSRFREFDGYRLPTRVDGGNLFGTADYFPFYRARVTAISFAR